MVVSRQKFLRLFTVRRTLRVTTSLLSAATVACESTNALDTPVGADALVAKPPSTCLAPDFPWLASYPPSMVVPFDAPSGLEVGLAPGDSAVGPTEWLASSTLTLPSEPGAVEVFARRRDTPADDARCAAVTRAVLQVAPAFSGPAGTPGTDAVPVDDPRIVGWAAEVIDVTFGTGVDERWRDLRQAEGPAGTDPLAALVLGNGGSVIVRLDTPARDGEGDDLAVFENAITAAFLELGYVDVSTDGVHWARFASAYLGDTPVNAYGAVDATTVEGLAGKYQVGFGAPFDLARLANRPEVQRGEVDLEDIEYVRVTDIIGDGSAFDSFGRPIYDPTPTFGSGGFDLDGVGILNAAPR